MLQNIKIKARRWFRFIKYALYSRDELIQKGERLSAMAKEINALIIENDVLTKQNKKLEKKNQKLIKLLGDLNGVKVYE